MSAPHPIHDDLATMSIDDASSSDSSNAHSGPTPSDCAANPPADAHASSSSVAPPSLLSLPEDVLHGVWEHMRTLELLRLMEHTPPSRVWQHAWRHMAAFDVDLERDVGHAAAAAAASTGASAFAPHTHVNTAAAAEQQAAAEQSNSMMVAQLLARKRADYAQLVRLMAEHARDLQHLSLVNFGTALSDEIPASGDGNEAPLRFQSALAAHRSSLTSLNLSASELRQLDLGPDFVVLSSLDLSRCRTLLDLRLDLPMLTSLDLSRSFLNDFELLRLLPRLPDLRVLKLVACKNLRKVDGEDAARLFGQQCPSLRIIDLSYTRVVDSSIAALTKHCAQLDALYVADCVELHAPQICSASLRTLSLRGCRRLHVSNRTLRIVCSNLRELDLSLSNLRDAQFVPGAMHFPCLEVLLMRECFELVDTVFRIETDAVVAEALGQGEKSDEAAAAGTGTSSSVVPPPQVYPHLRVLDIGLSDGFRPSALYRLLEMCPALEVLTLLQCRDVAAADANLGQTMVFPYMARLREVDLRRCAIGDDNLAQLLGSAPELTVLHLRSSPRISGATIRGSALADVDLRQTAVTDASLAALLHSDRCPNLTALSVAQCDRLREPRLQHATLRRLDVSNCRWLESLELRMPELQQLDVSANLSLLHVDLTECPSLQSLDKQSTPKVRLVTPLRSPSAPDIAVSSSVSAAVDPNILPLSLPLNAYSERQPARTKPPADGSASEASLAPSNSASSDASSSIRLVADHPTSAPGHARSGSIAAAGAPAVRAIRSAALCEAEERVRDLDTRVRAAEAERLAVLQRQKDGSVSVEEQAASGLTQAQASAAHLQSITAALYGLRKQLGVQRARLNKETRSLAAAAAAAAEAQQDDSTDNQAESARRDSNASPAADDAERGRQ